MASYEAGSVTAKVILDTSEWNKAIENLKTEVGELKTSLNAIKGKNGLDEQVKKLKEDISTLTETNKNYQKTIKDLRKTNSDLAKGTKTVSEALKTEQKNAATALNNFATQDSKVSETITKNTNKNIQNKRKEAEAVSKLNMEQREAALTAKRNERIYNNMRLEAFKYIDGLKRGRRSKGVIGTDTSLWAEFKDQKGRTKSFDWDRFADHMRNTFKGVIPDDVFKPMFRELTRKYQMGLVGWTAERGGIHEKDWKRLTQSAEFVQNRKDYNKKKQSKSRRNLLNSLGLDPDSVDYYGYRMENASKALNTFNRQLKTTEVDYRKLSTMPKPFDATIQEITEASTALKTFDRMLNSTQIKLRQTHELSNLGWKNSSIDPSGRNINTKGIKASVGLKLKELNNVDWEAEGFKKGREILHNYLKTWSEAPVTVKRSTTEIDNAIRQFAQFDWHKSQSRQIKDYLTQWGEAKIQVKKSAAEIDQALSKFAKGITPLNKDSNHYMPWVQWEKGAKKIVGEFTVLDSQLKHFPASFEKLTNYVNLNSQAQTRFTQTLLSNNQGVQIAQNRLKQYEVQVKSTFETMQVELAKANAAQYKYWKQVRGNADVKGYNQLQPLQFSYNDYLMADLDKINAKIAEFKRNQQSINDVAKYTKEEFIQASEGIKLFTEQLDQLNAKINKGTQSNKRLSSEMQILQTQIGHFSKSGIGKQALATDARYAQILSNRLQNISTQYSKGNVTGEKYRAELKKIEQEFSKLHTRVQTTTRDIQQNNLVMDKNGNVVNKNSKEYKQLEQNARKSGRGLTSFNNGVAQTAHSGRILSNTLYQIRGALLSLKMIFTAMGGMALWGFASDLAEGVKESFRAKNEMEAQLKQNKHVNSGGIEYFNNQLNELTKTFKKVNKYSIGETVSSIGLEFDLTSKQMADALPIVTMIQSEYVRAGRKESEAALAVKDILQGEFQRLSRETGVGKEELVAYGWDEDKTNIDGLLKALKKAALDRHWDIFAKKATSLNDVMTITKSRFSETGADIAQSATPLIVGAFNTLIDWIDNLQNSFNSLSSFWQHFTFIGGGTVIFGGILTALPMITKGMGLADIATIGWAKSVGTAVLNLNKAEVAQYGFRKALAAVISGTSAAELSETRWTKAIMGRILGVNQGILAERGYKSAIFNKNVALRNGLDLEKTHINLGKASILNMEKMTVTEMGRAQKLAYMTNNISLNEAAEMSRGKAILKTATSWKVLGTAIKGVMAIGIITWLASVASWTDKVKGYVNGLNEVWSNGKDLQKEAQDQVDTYTNQLDKYEKGTKEYIQAYRNLGQANANLTDIKKANELVKGYKKTNKELRENIKLRHQQSKAASYELTGMDTTAAKEQASGYASKVRVGEYYWTKSWEAYDDRLYKASQHTNEHIKQLQEVGVKGEELVRYVDEYNLEAENAATNWRKFNQGDFNAGVYAVLSELKLAWIDISHHPEVVKLSQDLGKAFNDMKPSLKQISQMLGDFVIDLAKLADWLSQNKGLMQALPWAGLALGIGIVGKKLYGFLGGTKSTIDILKTLGGKLKDRIKDWREYKDKVEDAKNAETGGTTTPTDETSKNSPKTWKKGEFWKTVGNDAKNIARNYAKVAVHLALAMGIVTEALLLLVAPMGALAEVGIVYKNLEPQIKQGVEGLKVIAPVLAVMLPPVVAIMFIMDKYKGSLGGTTVKGVVASVLGIAVGLLLVAEAIYMLKPSLWAIASLGDDYAAMKPQIENGKIAIQAVGDCLKMLVPFIPPMLVGVALMAAVFANPPIGIGLILTVVGGIALGMGLVAEAVYMLGAPLEAIAALGKEFNDLSDVKQGAEALKVTAEALGYVEQAMRAFTLIAWESLATSVATLIGIKIGVDLTQLTGEGGFFDQLETFTSEFNKIEITQIDTGKVETLKTSATGIDSVKTALVTVKDALKDLPNFEVDNRSTNQKYQDAVSGQETTSGITNYFEQLKQPIEQLNTFINNFNQLEISAVDPDKVATIQNSANFISTIKTAIDNVKAAVGSAVDTQWNANVQTSGLLGAGINMLVGNAGQSSGIKAGLDELYNCVKDIMNFNTRISGLTSEGSGDTSGITGASNMVSALQTQINSLKTTLSGAIPTIKSTAKGMGSAIITGFQSGMTTWTSTVKTSLSSANDSFKTSGETYGTKLKDGFKSKAKLKSTVQDEITYTFEYLDGKKEDFYNKGAALGDSLSQGFKDHKGLDQNSPGRMARAVSDELGFIGQAFSTGAGLNLPQMAANLAQTLSTNFNPSFTMGSLQLPNLDQFKQGLGQIPAMVTNVKTQVGTNFAGIQTSIGNSFNNIVSKTRLSLGTMLSATTKNIGSIRTSWKGMQSALIQSAENIKTQTGQKISKLKTNLGDFWNKIKHPDQLISGSAGGKPTGTIRRRSRPHIRTSGYAGTPMFKPKTSRKAPDYDISEYFKCLFATGSPCYAGWKFNWTKKISDKFNGWNTHFNKFNLDSHLNVGKFKNNNFPVKGNAGIFKDYVYDVIKGTTYDFYFNSNYGDDPVAALRAGHFNCWDGTNIIIALANAFGLNASQGHGTWNGIGHMFARVAGIGVIDPTAIQRGFGFTSPKVKGYSAGSPSRSSNSNVQMGNTYGDIHITINNNGEDMTVNEKNVDKQTSKKIYDILRPSLSTGK